MRKVKISNASKKFSEKLAFVYERPFGIIELELPTVYVLRQGEGLNRRETKTHVTQLKRYIPIRKLK